MFDISFLEIVVIAVISLLVLGPDKLPGAIRTAGLWIGRLKRSFNNIRTEIEREVGADEIRRQLRNEAIMDKIKHTRNQVTKSIDSVRDEVKSVSESANIRKEMDTLNQSLNPASSDSSAQPEPGQADTTGPDSTGPDKSTGGVEENRIAAGQPQKQMPEGDTGSPPGGTTPTEPPPRPATDPTDSGHNSNNADPDDKQRS